MSDPIDFYFDFSSPYGYFAADRIQAIGERHGREVRWRPYLLGVAMKETGAQPLTACAPLVSNYARHDFERCARLLELRFQLPEPFPIMSVAPSRAFYWQDGIDPGKGRELAAALYRAYFGEGRNITDTEVIAAVAGELGIDGEALLAGLDEQAVKDRLRDETGRAVARGAFGSPFVFVGTEPFWGHDRLDQVERWIETGGW